MKTNLPTRMLRTAIFAALTVCCFSSISIGNEPVELAIAHDEYLYMIRFSPDGKTLATAAGDNVVRVWKWPTLELLHTLEHDAAVYAAVFAPQEDLLATGSGDGKVSLWRTSSGRLVAERQEHADAVYSMSFAVDGQRLATIGGHGKKGDTRCRIWSVPSLEVTKVLPGHDRPAYGVLFGPDTNTDQSTNRSIVTSGGDKLIHVHTQSTDERRTLKGHTSDVYRCCLSHDGKQLVSTSQDGSVRLWDFAAGRQLKKVFQGKDPTYDVAYSQDGTILAGVGDDGFVRFWRAKDYELLLESKLGKEGLYSVVFTPDQANVLTGGVRGQVYQLRVPKLDAK